jgi:integrase
MNQEGNEIAVLNKQDLTNFYNYVNSKRELPKYWDKEYIHARLLELENPKHQMMLRFMWMTGVRVTEAINVRKCDINFKEFTILIRWQKNRKYNYRNIPMHPQLRDLLLMYTGAMLSEDLLFNMSRQRAWQIVQKTFDGHPHQFRHSFAVNWLRCSGDIIILSRMLGHSNLQSTMEYLKIVPTDLGKELIKITF